METADELSGDLRTDEALMLAYRDGEAAAFDVLYARHRAPLFRYVVHQCGRREAADELFQEIWMSVIRARAGYEVTAKFTTWLYRIAHNRLVDHFRASGRAEVLLAAPDADEDDQPADPYAGIAGESSEQPERRHERRELADRLIAAVDALPTAQREAFLMAAEGGMSTEEIARAADCGFETAKSRLRYAYGRLRQLLGDLR